MWRRDVASVVDGPRRVWFVFAEWERSYLHGNATQVWRWLDARFEEVDRLEFMNVDLRLYDATGGTNTVRRVRDDGVTSVLERAGDDEPYTLVTPDRELIAGTPTQRKGPLHLSLGGDAWEERHSVAQGSETRLLTFTLSNTGGAPVTCEVSVVACDRLIEAAALDNANASDWRTSGQHRPGNAGVDYDLHAAAVRLARGESATLEGLVTLAPGDYESAVFMLGSPGDPSHARADLSAALGAQPMLPDNTAGPVEWAWRVGNRIGSEGSAQPISLTASALPGQPESFADVAYAAFLRKRQPTSARLGAASLFAEPWPGRVTLPPGGNRSWTLEVDKDMGRVDVWVWDRAPEGMVYHVFDTWDAAEG